MVPCSSAASSGSSEVEYYGQGRRNDPVLAWFAQGAVVTSFSASVGERFSANPEPASYLIARASASRWSAARLILIEVGIPGMQVRLKAPRQHCGIASDDVPRLCFAGDIENAQAGLLVQ